MASRLVRFSILAALLVARLGMAADTVILVDHSGSMAPYYSKGLVQDLAKRIQSSCQASSPPDLKAFDSKVVNSPNLRALASMPYGAYTFLNVALDTVKNNYDQIWILTDNVQDDAGSHDMTDFYQALRSERIRHVSIFPMRQPPNTAPGFLIYAISTREDSKVLGGQIAEFLKQTQDLKLTELVMKPLGENAIRVEILGESGTMRFKEGSPLTFETRVRIGPKYSHLYFQSSPATTAQVLSPFRGESCLVSEKVESAIDPKFVQTQNATEYRVNLNFGRVRLKKTLPCIWHAGFERSHESGEIESAIVVQVPRSNLRLSDQFVEDFVANMPDDAAKSGKIFGLQSLPAFLAPETTEVPIRIPRNVSIEYPSWPAVVLLLAGLAVAVLLVVVISLLRGIKLPTSQIFAESEAGDRLPAELRGGCVYVSGQHVGNVKSHLFYTASEVKLESGTTVSSTDKTLLCVLRNGERIRLKFGTSLGGQAKGVPTGPPPDHRRMTRPPTT